MCEFKVDLITGYMDAGFSDYSAFPVFCLWEVPADRHKGRHTPPLLHTHLHTLSMRGDKFVKKYSFPHTRNSSSGIVLEEVTSVNNICA